MSDFVYFLKLFGLTIALVLVMQINVGEHSLETHAMNWLSTSPLVSPLNSAARGGGKIVHDVSEKVHAALNQNRAKKKKGEKPDGTTNSFHWSHAHPQPKSETSEDGGGDPD